MALTKFQLYQIARQEYAFLLRREGLTLEAIGKRLGVCREQARNLSKMKTAVNRDYQSRIRALPCLSCGKAPSECAHIRYSDARSAKDNPGIGARPEDRWCVPLCSDCHRGLKGQHTRGEYHWWVEKGIDPIFTALALWGVKGEYEASCKIIRHAYFHS